MVARGCAMGGSAGGERVVGGDRGRRAARALTKTMLFFRPGWRLLRYSGQGWNGRIVTSWGGGGAGGEMERRPGVVDQQDSHGEEEITHLSSGRRFSCAAIVTSEGSGRSNR